MAKQVQLRRGTTAQNDAFTGAAGELTVDTQAKTLRVHDGVTRGGTTLARATDADANKANISMNNINATGKSTIASMPMPSDKYQDITLGASPYMFVAPANGYVVFARTPSEAGQYNALVVCTQTSNQTLYRIDSLPSLTTHWGTISAPVQKGFCVKIEYNTKGTTKLCRFVYAAGDK